MAKQQAVQFTNTKTSSERVSYSVQPKSIVDRASDAIPIKDDTVAENWAKN